MISNVTVLPGGNVVRAASATVPAGMWTMGCPVVVRPATVAVCVVPLASPTGAGDGAAGLPAASWPDGCRERTLIVTWVPAGNPPWVAAPAARPSTAAPGPVLPGPGAPRVPCGVPEAAAELAGDGAVGPRPPPADAGRRADRDVSWTVPCPTPSGIGDPVLAAIFEGTRDWNPGPAIEDVRKTVATSVAPTASGSNLTLDALV